MKKHHFRNSAAIGIVSVFLFIGGCALQPKKSKAPAPLESEIKSIEGQKPSTYQSHSSSKSILPFSKDAEGGFPSEKITYVVKKGDTVWRISKMYGVPVETILRSNHIDNIKDLEVGQKLTIPVSGKPYTSFSSPASYTSSRATSIGISAKGFIWPVKGQVISQFGGVWNGIKNMGIGIQFQPDQKILASKKGTVEAVSETDGMYAIVIKHDGGVRTIYGCRCSPMVGEGNYVEQGQPIACINQVGTGKPQELNFKIYVKDKPVNPISYLP